MNHVAFNGLLVIDKPGGMTSRAALDRALRWFPRRTRMGHTGTLDPLATGVLVLCVGAATRLAEYVQRMAKTYRTTLHLGVRSDTDDADGALTAVAGAMAPDRETLPSRLSEFVGTIEQVPPAFSAAKVTGRRAYDLAREGEEVILQPRRIRIDGIDLLRYEYPELDLEIRCGKGTYIRSLARDLGERLGCGGHVQMLRRTSVGPFDVENAVSLDADAATARARLHAPVMALHEMPRVSLSPHAAKLLVQGREVRDVTVEQPLREEEEVEVAVFDNEQLIAIAIYDKNQRSLRPTKVLI